ncbi:tyrosine-type recombinase/integrase [uncultured Methylobacterium sp.]|uniref:tyrosine-type recombinase/integrase n=1 Tax=uncultured Methylobacterium sp. TaxID=157278 RepID=UPI0035CA9083
MAKQFLAYCRGRMERRERMTRGTFEVYTGHVHNYVCPPAGRSARTLQNACAFEAGLASVKLRQLTGRAVGDFRDRLRAANRSVAMTRKVLGTLRLILAYAIGRDLITVNMAQGVRVIGRRDEGSKVIVAPSKEAVRQLLAAADPDFRVVLLFAAMTGLRAGEMHALRWRHLDIGGVRIETRVDEFGEEDATKTTAGMRTVPLGAGTVAALRDWQVRTCSLR